MVPWMSGLVNGLQNRLRRFDPARHLEKSAIIDCGFFLLVCDYIFYIPTIGNHVTSLIHFVGCQIEHLDVMPFSARLATLQIPLPQ